MLQQVMFELTRPQKLWQPRGKAVATCPDVYRHGLSAVNLSAFDRSLASGIHSFLIWGTCARHTCSPAAESLLASSAWGESSQGHFRAHETQDNTVSDAQTSHRQNLLAMQIFMLRKMQSGLTLSVQGTLQIGPFAQWTMDCKLSLCPSDHSNQSKVMSQHNFGQATLAVGLSNNAVQMHKLMMVEAEMVG